jgi:hypothetical protein
MLITGCGSRFMGCCGGMGGGVCGLGATGPAEPCSTGTGRPFAVRLVIFYLAVVLWACYGTHAFVDRIVSLMDPGLPVS